jgi:hypothetical protein
MKDEISEKAVKAAADVSQTTIRIIEGTIKKAWSILDAASEKKPPSEMLSPKAITAIQGNE